MAFFPETNPPGHEQFGFRPAVVVGVPDTLGEPRYSVALVTPLTTDTGDYWMTRSPALYPRVPAGSGGGVREDSIALLDQTRSLDTERIDRFLGTLPSEAYARIRDGLLRMLGIG